MKLIRVDRDRWFNPDHIVRFEIRDEAQGRVALRACLSDGNYIDFYRESQEECETLVKELSA